MLKQTLGQEVFVQVTPEPMLPFFTFVVASVLSLVLGHVATECNRHGLRVIVITFILLRFFHNLGGEAWKIASWRAKFPGEPARAAANIGRGKACAVNFPEERCRVAVKVEVC